MPRRGRITRMWRRLKSLEAQVSELRQPPEPQRASATPLEGQWDVIDQVMAGASHQPCAELETEVTVTGAPAAEQDPRPCHLLIGDSIARDASLVAVDGVILNLANGGATFRKLAETTAAKKVTQWQEFCRVNGHRRGTIVIWCGGNDAYSDGGLRKEDVARTLAACGDEEILLICPTPRLRGHRCDPDGINWRTTKAYFADATIAAAAGEAPNERRVSVLRHMGRLFCVGSKQTFGKRADLFAKDGIHLSAAGYRRLADRISANFDWLEIRH
ncbi:hypothetical protein FJT64_004844 [Amphibalanus amphitrite]|uniref:SGNH hydrolase-type esterase domain-containing protein n=1 Tax=Amphibalanus amphitrite TaxID=1232801 RepID=A0A6A4VNK0_AMPAM|nr:hypothetical protein FJT64_004844 [Amphibalanus amphitrite]